MRRCIGLSMGSSVGLLALLAAASASAQVTLSTVQGGVATPTGAAYDFNSVALGSVADVEFELTNTGSSAVYLTSLALAGATTPTPPYTPYFSVVCAVSPDLCAAAAQPQLPILINPTGTLNFTVQFQPFQLGSPSATMTIAAGNTFSVILLGTGVAGLSLLFDNQPVGAGETVSFGDVPAGTSRTLALMLTNQTTAALTVPAIALLNAMDFSIAGSAVSGPTLAPGSSAELDVTFAPASAGAQQGTLSIGLISYAIQGTGVAPPALAFPAPSIQLNLPTPASAQQGSLSITLAQASAATGSGTVALAFQSAVSGVSGDPAVTFADGTVSQTFTVAEGASLGQFAAGPSVAFGTGTTAGMLTFTVTLGSNTAQANVTIPPALIGIDAAVAARNVECAPSVVYCTTTNVQLQINGWDNTRSASQLVFSFFDSAGAAIAPGNITVPAATAFEQYFAASDMAGVFGVNALFPVTGNSNQVVTALVRITNSVGTVETDQITF